VGLIFNATANAFRSVGGPTTLADSIQLRGPNIDDTAGVPNTGTYRYRLPIKAAAAVPYLDRVVFRGLFRGVFRRVF
jgi:hypothetical protein